jgi:hypothetical protein
VARRITSDQHRWVGATNVRLDPNQARYAQWRGYVDIPESERIVVLEVYCGSCRRPYEDVSGEPCIAADTNEHLRGGPIGERKKRKHNHDCALVGCDHAAAV